MGEGDRVVRIRPFNSRLERAAFDGIDRGLIAASFQTQRELKLMLSKPGAGRRYKGNPTTSSAPGQPPAAQTGTLRASVSVNSAFVRGPSGWLSRRQITTGPNRGMRPPGGRIGALRYGAFLESGTRRMLARPWVKPTIRIVRPKAVQLIGASVRKSLAAARVSR